MKTLPVSVRLSPDVKAALEEAAEADSRSISSYMEKVLAEHLREKGWLRTKGGKR